MTFDLDRSVEVLQRTPVTLDALLRGLDGSQPLLVTVNRQQDIISALRVAQEFKLKIILDGCADERDVKTFVNAVIGA